MEIVWTTSIRWLRQPGLFSQLTQTRQPSAAAFMIRYLHITEIMLQLPRPSMPGKRSNNGDPDALFGETLAAWSDARSEVKLRLDRMALQGHKSLAERKNIIVIGNQRKRPVTPMCGFGISDNDGASGFIWGMFVSSAQRRKNHGQTFPFHRKRKVGCEQERSGA